MMHPLTAAKAVGESRERLTRAYVQFVGSLAQALDARDSGFELRTTLSAVSAYSQAFSLPPRDSSKTTAAPLG
jgi:hypothetical protein